MAPALRHGNRGGRRGPDPRTPLHGPALASQGPGLGPLQHAGDSSGLRQPPRQHLASSGHARRPDPHHDHLAVAVRDETRETIPLGVHQPMGLAAHQIGVAATPLHGLGHPPEEPLIAGLPLVEVEHPHADLRVGRVVAMAQYLALVRADGHEVSRPGLPLQPGDRPRENPRVATPDRTVPARLEDEVDHGGGA